MPKQDLKNQIPAPRSAALERGIQYTATPTLEKWKKDSSVTLATRSDDEILTHIDQILKAYEEAGDWMVKIQLKCDLFFTLDYWLKIYKTTSGMKSGREPAVFGLYKYVAQSMCDIFKCSINNLPEQLELNFGRRMSYHGEKRDLQQDCAIYLKRSEVQKYKLRFKKGVAYMFDWPGKGQEAAHGKTEATHVPEGKLKLVEADSRTASNPGVFNKSANWGGFAMSMGRDLYMARHHCDTGFGEQGNFYHSSYLGGDPVLCAGTMKIVHGAIIAIANDSGHYQPDSSNFLSMLEALKMHGVDVANIEICEYQSQSGTYLSSKASDFLAARGNWVYALKNNLATIKSANQAAQKHYLTESRADEQLILSLWKRGISSGIIYNTPSGREFFAGTLLQNYINHSGRAPFQGVVNTTWILAALDRAIGRLPPQPTQTAVKQAQPLVPNRQPPLPPGQQHGQLPPRPLAPGQQHGKLPPRPLPPGQGHGQLPPRP